MYTLPIGYCSKISSGKFLCAVDGVWCRLITSQSAEEQVSVSVPLQIWHLYHPSSPKAQESLWKMGFKERKSQSSRKKIYLYETVSSGHDGTVALMNSEQLWLATQDLCNVKPVNSSWALTSSWWLQGEGEPVVFKGMASGVLIKLQWMAQTHEYMSNTNVTRGVIKRKECRKLRGAR